MQPNKAVGRLFQHRERNQIGLSAAAFAPMIDLFTILVVAVLRGATVEPPLELPSQQLQPPLSSSEAESSNGMVIDVAQDGIYVDGRRTTGTQFWLNNDAQIITAVYQRLQQNPGSAVRIRCDEQIPWALISKLLLTAEQAGSSEIELIALSNKGI